MRVFKVSVRLNFLGGWSDQVDWPFSGAVVNASVGWDHVDGCSPYPMCATGDEQINNSVSWASVVQGQGTGLGISSIRAAVEYIAKAQSEPNFAEVAKNFSHSYIESALEWEQKNGTKGGWQDQIGAISPGFKLIRSDDHKEFCIEQIPSPAIWSHLVLFDTGIRRPAKTIGDNVRKLMFQQDKGLVRTLKQHVKDAIESPRWDAERFAKTCVEHWQRWITLVPEMAVEVPKVTGLWGTMLMGAGGGGYGVAFVIDPDNRQYVIEQFQRAGFWAAIPVLLDGLKVEEM